MCIRDRQKYDFIDAIMRGEGEATFKEWLEIGEMADGITYRENGEIIRNKDRELIHDITSIPDVYKRQLQSLRELIFPHFRMLSILITRELTHITEMTNNL